MPTSAYRSVEDFYETVTIALQSLQDKVETFGMQDLFWDTSRDGQRITSRKPKYETEIHPGIHGLLADIALIKNLQISREYPLVGGNLDFLISGTLGNAEVAHVCVEFKHAHSDDLIHGLVNQLPAYMKGKACNYGIYCAMYSKGQDFSEPRKHDLGTLELERRKAGLTSIRTIILDLSRPVPLANCDEKQKQCQSPDWFPADGIDCEVLTTRNLTTPNPWQ